MATNSQSVDPTPLFDYGIKTENSDIRCHVAPGTRCIFVFRTQAALGLPLSRYQLRDAFQTGVNGRTAQGYVVPWRDVPDIRRVRWVKVPWWERFNQKQTTSEKGKHAVWVVSELLQQGRIPLWVLSPYESEQTELQIKGTDLLLWARWRIQVKCDWLAGDVEDGGSGNLFLQVAERNPLRRI